MMKNINEPLSQKILEKREILTKEISEIHFRKLEKLKSRRIDYLKQKTKEDTEYNIIHLSEAIRYGSEVLFHNYVIWLKTLLKYYGVSLKDLVEHFEVLKDVMAQNFNSEQMNIINDYLDTGLDALKKDNIKDDSFLNENNEYYTIANEYLKAILATERNQAIKIIIDAVQANVSIDNIYLNVFQPVQYQIGLLWQTNQISVGQEHYATAVTQLAMSQLYQYIFTQEKKEHRFVACGVSEELHELGIRMVADIFELYGWDTYFLGANTPADSVVKLIDEKEIEVLALSATILFHLKKVEEFIAHIRRSASNIPKIIVGGYVFNSTPDLWKKVGADAFANDPIKALDIAKSLIN